MRYLVSLLIGVPFYILLYGSEHVIEKLRGRREEYTWLGQLKYVVCLRCNAKIRLPLKDPCTVHRCSSDVDGAGKRSHELSEG